MATNDIAEDMSVFRHGYNREDQQQNFPLSGVLWKGTKYVLNLTSFPISCHCCAQGLKLSLRCAHFLSEKKGMVESTFSSTLTDECELRMCTNNSQILDVCVWCIVRRSFLKKKAWQDDQDPDVQQVIYVWRTILFSSAESTKWQQNHFKNTYFGQISFIVLASNCILSWIMHMRKGVLSWRVYFLRMTNGL